MELLNRSARSPRPWKNGLGFTEDVLVSETPGAGDDPLWRISIATIDADVPFSRFDGIERLLMPISPSELSLNIDGRQTSIPQFGVVSFPGEAFVLATGVVNQKADLNVMVRRGHAIAEMSRRYMVGTSTVPAQLRPGEIAIAVILSRTLLYNGKLLELGDALVLDATPSAYLGGFGNLAIVRIRSLTGEDRGADDRTRSSVAGGSAS
ncbi:MAG: hypothetical protein JWP32_327 [Schumannella sp.]|nr:hypothetical protein [Schumannella sp.]